jgi:soluble P-type ATPase
VLAGAVVSGAVRQGRELTPPADVQEVPGQGVRGTVAGRPVAVGDAAWCGVDRVDEHGSVPDWVRVARRRARLDGALTVFVAVDDAPAGVLVLDDAVRPDASGTIRALRAGGIDRVVMVTGDRSDVADMVGVVIGADDVLAERTPAEKLEALSLECRRAPTVMVGDGISDAPALAVADVGVAMGARGAYASPSADAVLTVDRVDRLGEAARAARRTGRIARQGVIAGMGMSCVAMVVAGLGWLPPVWGALAQEAIDVAVIMNALRALRQPSAATHLPAADTALAQRFRGEHEKIRLAIDQVRAAADALGVASPEAALATARRAYTLLVEVIEPHAAAEQHELYPALNRVLGGTDLTGTMSRAHAEISHQIRRLGGLLDDIGTGPPDQVDIADLRSLMYGLHAIMRLHTAQEDESYLSLAAEAAPRPS